MKAFDVLKERLSRKPILAIYSLTAEMELHCDASTLEYGAIFLQKQDCGKFEPLASFSQRTTEAESKFHTFELECLAVLNAFKRFHVYLGGIHFNPSVTIFGITSVMIQPDTRVSTNRFLLYN